MRTHTHIMRTRTHVRNINNLIIYNLVLITIGAYVCARTQEAKSNLLFLIPQQIYFK